MEKRYTEENDEIEIDIRELLFEFKKRIWLILAALVIGGAAVGAFSRFLITPQYQSEAKLYVLSKETTLTSLADLQIGSQLTQDYKVLVGSRPVMQGVISHLNLALTYRELAKKLTVDNPQNTRILTLTVEDADPRMAKAIVDDIANTASDYIGEIMEMVPPKLIEDGVLATEQSSPNVLRNALVGGLLAMLFVCGILTARVVLNDTVKTEEDVEKYLSLPVLAVIPKKTEKGDKKQESGKREKAKRSGRGNHQETRRHREREESNHRERNGGQGNGGQGNTGKGNAGKGNDGNKDCGEKKEAGQPEAGCRGKRGPAVAGEREEQPAELVNDQLEKVVSAISVALNTPSGSNLTATSNSPSASNPTAALNPPAAPYPPAGAALRRRPQAAAAAAATKEESNHGKRG